MRTIFLLVVVLSAVVGLVNSGGAEPTITPPNQALIAAPPPPVRRSAHEFSGDEMKALKEQFITLMGKRAEQMNGLELQQSIAEMRRQYLMSELLVLSRESRDDEIGAMRAEVAAFVLGVKDKKELEAWIRTSAKQLESAKPPTD